MPAPQILKAYERQCPECRRTVAYNGPTCADCRHLVHRKCSGAHRCPAKATRIALQGCYCKAAHAPLHRDLVNLLLDASTAHFDAGEWERDDDDPWDTVFQATLDADAALHRKLAELQRDADALAEIHAQLDGRQWEAEDLDAIAAILIRTGRTIYIPAGDEGDPRYA